MGVGLEALLGGRDADQLEELDGPGFPLFGRRVEVDAQRLLDLKPDGEHRVERCHRVLEDEPDLAATNRAQCVDVELEEILVGVNGFAGDDLARRHRDQPQQRHHRHALAGTTLADHTEELAAADLEADAVDGVHNAVLSVELGRQVGDLEHRLGLGRYHCLPFVRPIA